MKRKHLKVIIVLTVLLLAVAVGLAIPALLHPGEGTEAIPATEQLDAESYASNPGELFPVTSEDTSAPDQPADTPLSDNTVTTDETAPGDPAQTPESSSSTGTDGNPDSADPLTQADLTNQSWVEAKIEANRHRIADEDLDDFRTIIGKLDMNHINAILEGRINPDIEDTLRTYLRSRLNAAEYERAKVLFVTYEHLLFE